jgi:hypothetical protein
MAIKIFSCRLPIVKCRFFRRGQWLRLCLRLNPKFFAILIFSLGFLRVAAVDSVARSSPSDHQSGGRAFSHVKPMAFSSRRSLADGPLPSASRYLQSLYGETAGESFACKLATAYALRNRGTLRGVYGLQSPLLRKPIDVQAWADCVMAWKLSATGNDPTKGADHWACRSDLARPYLRDLICTGRIGRHWFFKKK